MRRMIGLLYQIQQRLHLAPISVRQIRGDSAVTQRPLEEFLMLGLKLAGDRLLAMALMKNAPV